MKTKIAVATINGRAYYHLVQELKRRHLPFLSLKPWDPIPVHIEVVITTDEETDQISHSKALLYDLCSNPETIVDEATLIIQGKKSYEKVLIGIDPGKTYGIAIIGDNKILQTLTSSSNEETVHLVLGALRRFPASTRIIRVGNGPPEHTRALLDFLAKELPEETTLEIVGEAGTSRFTSNSVNRGVLKDVVSAIRIASRNGKTFLRKDNQ